MEELCGVKQNLKQVSFQSTRLAKVIINLSIKKCQFLQEIGMSFFFMFITNSSANIFGFFFLKYLIFAYDIFTYLSHKISCTTRDQGRLEGEHLSIVERKQENHKQILSKDTKR